LAIAVARSARKLCDPLSGESYGQGALDQQILGYFSNRPPDYYVDLGCHYPDKISNTYIFYQKGWRGLCVDANPSLVERFKRARPKDVVAWACVGEKSGETTFAICNDPGLSHVLGDVPHFNAGDEARRITVPVKTLRDLFEEYGVPNRFGLLSIDIEGSDLAALQSSDFHRWRPDVIVVEIHDDSFELEQFGKNEIIVFLRSVGYKFVGYSDFSAIFRNAEGPDWSPADTAFEKAHASFS
jgi:FkbM family methyltransferase